MVTSLAAPAQDSMQPAYGTLLLFDVVDDGSYAGAIPPVMYCDVYLDNNFYKTISSSSPTPSFGIHSIWQFAIEGVVQEFMRAYPRPDVTVNTIFPQVIPSFTPPPQPQSFVDCFCKFRLSAVDAYGVITPEGPVPVQGSVGVAPISGGGYASDAFMVINAALQWNTDPFSLENLLIKYRLLNTFVFGMISPTYRVYGLSKLQKIKVYTTDYGQFHLAIPLWGYDGAMTCNIQMKVFMVDDAGAIFTSLPFIATSIFSEAIYTMPCGLPVLSALVPGIIPHIPDTHHYFIVIFDTSVGACIFRTPDFVIQNRAKKPSGAYYNPAPPAHKRIYFQNYFGQLDMINFVESEETVKITSNPTESPNYNIQPLGIRRAIHTQGRYNIRSNEYTTVTGYFNEDELQQMKEFVAAKQGYIETPGPDVGYLDGTTPILLPIVIVDTEIITGKFEGRYEYAISIRYYMSNEDKIPRS